MLFLDSDDTESHKIIDSRLDVIKETGPFSAMGEYNIRCLEASSGELIMVCVVGSSIRMMSP